MCGRQLRCGTASRALLLDVTWPTIAGPQQDTLHAPCDQRRAAKELYVAEIDGKVLVKIGAKSYEPEDAAWRPADKGKAWALWLR